MNYNLIAFTSNVARVYEIAQCGKHAVKFLTPANSQDTHVNPEDLKLIKQFYKIVESENPDIILEVVRPDASEMLRALNAGTRFETKKDIDTRIKLFRASVKTLPAFDPVLKGACESLLKTAIDRIPLSFTEVLKVLNVAKTIAQMSGANVYKPEHVAEAIQYLSVKA